MKAHFKIHIVLILFTASWIMIDDSIMLNMGAIEIQIEHGNQFSDQSHHVNPANLIHYITNKRSISTLVESKIVAYYLMNFNTSSQPYYFKVWQPPELVIA